MRLLISVDRAKPIPPGRKLPPQWRPGMERAFPKLRSDLEIRAESSETGSPLIVKNSLLRHIYRFAPIQAAVLRRLDGKQDSVSLAKDVSEEEKTEVTAAQVQDF